MSPVEPDPKGGAERRTELALQRTIIAAERTLMAWIRTSISMIGFGFSIYKFFEYEAEALAAGSIKRPQQPRNLGMTLIVVGTLALAAAVWQHQSFLQEIGARKMRDVWSIAFMVSLVVIVIGIIAFYGVLERAGPF